MKHVRNYIYNSFIIFNAEKYTRTDPKQCCLNDAYLYTTLEHIKKLCMLHQILLEQSNKEG